MFRLPRPLPAAYRAAFETSLSSARRPIRYFQTLAVRRALELLNGFRDHKLFSLPACLRHPFAAAPHPAECLPAVDEEGRESLFRRSITEPVACSQCRRGKIGCVLSSCLGQTSRRASALSRTGTHIHAAAKCWHTTQCA